jgi:hypothetical protein
VILESRIYENGNRPELFAGTMSKALTKNPALAEFRQAAGKHLFFTGAETAKFM